MKIVPALGLLAALLTVPAFAADEITEGRPAKSVAWSFDGPFGNFSDGDGFTAAARRAAALGCEGKWAIHPSQVALANEAMSPSDVEVGRARRILAAMDEAAKSGRGAVSLDGKLIDYASIRQAEVLVRKAEQIGAA